MAETPDTSHSAEPAQTLTAYRLGDTTGWKIEPPSRAREWMDNTPRKAAYWCLPITMANQAGWVVRLPGTVCATWNGKTAPDAVKLEFPGKTNRLKGLVSTNFGGGIVSFALPWVFKTADGTGLWVRGEPNSYTPDCVPLEGIVETDWAPFPFTMNYRIVKRNAQVYFPEGMALCLLAPVKMDLFEATAPSMVNITEEPELMEEIKRHGEKRKMQTGQLKADEGMRDSKGNMKPVLDYYKGETTQGEKHAKHRKAFEIQRFEPDS